MHVDDLRIGPYSNDQLRQDNQRLHRELLEARANLRDQFAMAALQGLLASGANYHESEKNVRLSYAHADAMMKERGE